MRDATRMTPLLLSLALALGPTGCSIARDAAPTPTCASEAQACSGERPCCAGMACLGAACLAVSTDPAGACACVAEGAPCPGTGNVPCCPGTVCSDGPGGRACLPAALCLANGQQCPDSAWCCSANCMGNLCVPWGCAVEGAGCTFDAECCSGTCVIEPGATSGTCAPACGITGAPCMISGDCCRGTCEIAPGATTSTCAPPCRPTGGNCLRDGDCCEGTCLLPDGAASGACACVTAP